MKLLPCIIPFIKDAAKAVKRISQEQFKEVLDETLTELLGIAALVVRMYAIRREGEHEVLHLWCAHREEIALCVYTLRLGFLDGAPGRTSMHPPLGCVGQKDVPAFHGSSLQMRTLWAYLHRGVAIR